MRCPRCGASTRTLETRSLADGLINKRRRECFNTHRFWTFEVDDSLEGTILKYATRRNRLAGKAKDHERARRDQRIVRMINAGQKYDLIAEQFGLAITTICYVARKAGLPPKRQSKKVLQR